jgi:hypothetical protein
MQSGDPIESQFDRETQIEFFVQKIIKARYVLKPNLARAFASFVDKRTIPHNITWERMKKEYGWGYSKGSRIDPLITWVYIRPDVKKALKTDGLTLSEVFTNLVLINEHYFIVEKKAIAYLKLHCNRVTFEEEEEEDDEALFYIYIYI